MINIKRLARISFTIIGFSLLYSIPTSAQIARVFLSGTGNDLNVCTDQTTPCRSLQGAVNQCPIGGEIIVLTSGGFGTANITQSLTINAPAGVVAFNARTITINAGPADKVVIRGLSMNGTVFGDPNGVLFSSGGTLIVENCLFTGFGGTGIAQKAPGSTLIVHNSEFRHNLTDGIQSVPTIGVQSFLTVENSRFEGNGGDGIKVGEWVQAGVRLCVATGNDKGYEIINSLESSTPHTFLMLDDDVASNNFTAGIAVSASGQGSAAARMTHCTVTGNGTGLLISAGGSLVSYGTNQVWHNGVDGAPTLTVPRV
jgi:hypothetical protein